MKHGQRWRDRVDRDMALLGDDQVPHLSIDTMAPPSHRPKNAPKKWPFNACVARPISKREIANIPEARAAQLKEWDKLVKKGAFDMDSVQEWSVVARRAQQRGKTAHMGIVFGFCVQKNAELVDQPLVYKYRYVFQGNRVKD